jgi:glutamyl-tRNA(Gln) amidotransferase subunit D
LDEGYLGYKGFIAKRLEELNADVGDKVRIVRKDKVLEGLLMPREALYGSKPYIVIKLQNGYNIGVKIGSEDRIEIIEKRRRRPTIEHWQNIEDHLDKPHVILLSTGGTIASKIDYETGAVKPALSVAELVEWIPEIENIAYIDAREILRVFSEDISPLHWETISREVYSEMKKGVDGIVVAHGTDMMAYTAAALAFAIKNKPVPVVLVGSQRSSDRPSTDSAFNLKAAILTAAKAPFAESVVVMHGETGDTYALAHRGVKVRKMHTSRRDAFQSINDYPIAKIFPDSMKIEVIGKILFERNPENEPELMGKFDDKVALVKAYPGFHGDIIDYLVDSGYHGIVLEGSGLGHIANNVIPRIARATRDGIPVVVTSQCLFGRVNLHVYATGRRLLEAGVIPGSDMLPETAYVKLSWILGSITRDIDEVRRIMSTNIAGEINPRITVDLYPRWPLP